MKHDGMIEFYGSDERIAKMTTSIPHPLPPGLTDDYLTRAMAEDRTEDVWVLDATKTGGAEVMGVVSLQRLDRNQSEVHYWVAPAFWNDGVARTAVQALTLANPLENSTYFASVFRDNEASNAWTSRPNDWSSGSSGQRTPNGLRVRSPIPRCKSG